MVMSKTYLLEIQNVDQLFEQNNVSEIDEINRKLQNEIETKKEDLRTMVGERYRDLLKAADTIADMKNTSTFVINHVDNIITSCKILNEKHLIGFKTADNDYQKKINRNVHNNFYGIIIQIKILAGLPEFIWTHIDNENYFVATQLFILSRHISTGLQLDSNNEIMKRFPVAKQQWTILSQFYFTIKLSCIQTLEREDNLTAHVVAKCLASMMLLENCQFDKLLSILIQAKCKTFMHILSEDNSKYDKVKDKILASLNVLNETTQLIYECFIESGDKREGLLITELKQLTDTMSLPTIALIQSEDAIMMNTLPDIIAKYKPQLTLNPINIDTVKKAFNTFLQHIDNICKTQLKSLINLITSINIIHDIKFNANAIAAEKHATGTYDFLPDPNFNFFSFFYQNLLNNRITNIVNSQWKSILNEINSDVKKLLSSEYPDLKKIIWTEHAEDIPLSLKNALNDDQHEHKLLMKIKGFNEAIVDVCVTTVDHNLRILYNDLNLYLTDHVAENGKAVDGSKGATDNNSIIIQYLNECSRTSISELITQIRTHNFSATSENYLILGRLFQAIKELTSNLKLCLMPIMVNLQDWSAANEDDNQDKQTPNLDNWHSICGLLEEESIRYWRMWLNIFIKNWSSMLIFTQNYDLNTLLNDFPSWDIIKIKEKDEEDNMIESTIRIPSQPSYALQQFIYGICSNLSSIVPHTIPKQINSELMDTLISTLLKHYKNLSDLNFIQTNQNASLQYYFDIKLIMLLFVGRDSKPILDGYHNLLGIYKAFIDPFDFDVFSPYMSSNIKKCAYRMQNQLGCLISNLEHLSSSSSNNPPSAQDRDPNVLALSSTLPLTTWFPLLPIVNVNAKQQSSTTQSTTASSSKENSSGVNEKNQTNKKSKLKEKSGTSSTASAAQNYASNAAAFFGNVMSQEWFRTN